MDIADPAAELLFLKYAMPSTLGREGQRGLCSGDVISAQKADERVARLVAEGKDPGIDAKACYRVAYAWCGAVAASLRRDRIDEDSIRAYFWFVHNPVVERRAESGEALDAALCSTRVGEVVGVDGPNGKAAVTFDGALPPSEVRTMFVADAAKGERVAVHFDYAVERVTPELEARMAALSKALDSGMGDVLRELGRPSGPGRRLPNRV